MEASMSSGGFVRSLLFLVGLSPELEGKVCEPELNQTRARVLSLDVDMIKLKKAPPAGKSPETKSKQQTMRKWAVEKIRAPRRRGVIDAPRSKQLYAMMMVTSCCCICICICIWRGRMPNDANRQSGGYCADASQRNGHKTEGQDTTP
ncbi:hypothetical protein B0I35DRAFT_411092 [Stachybotrys elegans]|uniref:Uncharacterized protein n=1 Tax=Stachybotrys elegans TaxID=80388 RepID=A0A8K0WNC4_9HYPO|nr:hypothetical protein B0I35DRAFT_411092 [Stachybotrys elegans]